MNSDTNFSSERLNRVLVPIGFAEKKKCAINMSSLPKFILNMPSGRLSLLSMDYQATGRKKRIFAKYLSFQEAAFWV